jgi:hypothetical protein
MSSTLRCESFHHSSYNGVTLQYRICCRESSFFESEVAYGNLFRCTISSSWYWQFSFMRLPNSLHSYVSSTRSRDLLPLYHLKVLPIWNVKWASSELYPSKFALSFTRQIYEDKWSCIKLQMTSVDVDVESETSMEQIIRYLLMASVFFLLFLLKMQALFFSLNTMKRWCWCSMPALEHNKRSETAEHVQASPLWFLPLLWAKFLAY